MALTINNLIRKFATYQDDSVSGIAEADVTSTIIPMAEKMFYEMTLDTMSISSYASASTTNSVADYCMAHLSCYIMDHMMDRIHIDPETGKLDTNRHWEAAMQMMLNIWGIMVDGQLVLPGQVEGATPAMFLGRVDSQLIQADWKNTAVYTMAAREKYGQEITTSFPRTSSGS